MGVFGKSHVYMQQMRNSRLNERTRKLDENHRTKGIKRHFSK